MSELKQYRIAIHGCDDSTIFDMELTESEAEFLDRVKEMSFATSTYGCMPTIEVTLSTKSDYEVSGDKGC